MKTKEEKKARKEAKVAEWLVVFRRSYEMSRAYGKTVKKAIEDAITDTNKAIFKDWSQTPQDRMFLVDCKMIIMERLKDTAIACERGMVA